MEGIGGSGMDAGEVRIDWEYPPFRVLPSYVRSMALYLERRFSTQASEACLRGLEEIGGSGVDAGEVRNDWEYPTFSVRSLRERLEALGWVSLHPCSPFAGFEGVGGSGVDAGEVRIDGEYPPLIVRLDAHGRASLHPGFRFAGLEGIGGSGVYAGEVHIDCEDPPLSSANLTDLYSLAAYVSKERMEETLLWLEAYGKASLINKPDENGKCPLHWAAVHGNLGSLEALTKCSAVDLHARDKDGRTALVLTVLEGNCKVVTQLCEVLHIDPNIKDTSGKTALDYAKEGKRIEIEMELMKREDVKVYEDGLHRIKQEYLDKANLILTFGTVVTIATIGSYGALPTSATDYGAHFVLKTYPVVVSLIVIPVIFGIAAIVAAFLSYIPNRHISATIVYVRRTTQVAFIMLLLWGVSALALAGRIIFFEL